jgi:hypothetical protein
LVSDHWCYAFGIWFICFAVGTAFHLIWNQIFTINAYTFSGTIMGSIPSFLVNPIAAVMVTIMYINLRVEKEGLNAAVFSHELGVEADYGSFIDPDQVETGKNKSTAPNLV